MDKLRILVCGGRHFSDYALLEKTINGVIAESGREDIEIVSGHCIGADRLGELYAEKHNAQVKIFPRRVGKVRQARRPYAQQTNGRLYKRFRA